MSAGARGHLGDIFGDIFLMTFEKRPKSGPGMTLEGLLSNLEKGFCTSLRFLKSNLVLKHKTP